MRHSSLRHPVAIVRKVVGMSQPVFAKLVGIAESTLAKIESLRLPLSKDNAIRITDETGVSMRWLIAGNTQEPPHADEFRFNQKGGKYPRFDQQLFEKRRAQIQGGESPDVLLAPYMPTLELQAMAVTARDRDRQYMFNHKLRAAVDDLAKEFPIDADEMKRREMEIVARRILTIELVSSRGRVAMDLMRQHANDEATPLLRSLIDYGIAIGARFDKAGGNPRKTPTPKTVKSQARSQVRRKTNIRKKIKRGSPS